MIDREAVLVIKTITNTAIEISENEEEIDMCKAIDDMMNESRAKGRAEGKAEGQAEILVKQVKKGRLTIEEAAEDAGMTVEFFTIYKNCMCIIKNFLFPAFTTCWPPAGRTCADLQLICTCPLAPRQSMPRRNRKPTRPRLKC